MTKQQVAKILKIGAITTAVMFIFEIVFYFTDITVILENWASGQTGWLIYVALWVLMFLQATVVPIPSITVLSAAMGASLIVKSAELTDFQNVLHTFGSPQTWLVLGLVLTAYLAGAALTYLAGRKWGKKAVKWCAGSEEEYTKWSGFLMAKGKWPYAATVVLPIFPDGILCLVAGAVKLNFSFFLVVNFIGRAFGLIALVGSLILIGAGGESWYALVAWAVALVAQVVVERILTHKIKKENQSKN